MPDLETRLPQMLHDLSNRMPVDAELERPTLRRTRRRRLLNAGAAALLVGAVVGGGLTGVSALAPAPSPSVAGSNDGTPQEPTPAPTADAIEAIWPETTLAGLQEAQAQIDGGHSPWRTDPEQTAVAFATNMMGWAYEDVASGTVERADGHATVWIKDPQAARIVVDGSGGRADPRTIVKLAQLGETGENGVWSVLAVEGQMIRLRPTIVETGGALEVAGSLTYVSEAETVRVDVLDGADLNTSVAGGVAPLGPDFHVRFPAVESTDGLVTVLVRVLWSDGRTLAATAVPVTVGPTSASLPPSAPPPEPARTDAVSLPDAVAQTKDAILRAVERLDFPALAALIDPDTFVYNLDDGSDPIPAWKERPSVLDAIPLVLALPPAEPRDVEGYGTLYVWPYLMDTDLAHLTEGERQDLHSLGFDDPAIDLMVRGGTYLGPRLTIDENGLWRNYVTGGD